jgi:hypothetical protein
MSPEQARVDPLNGMGEWVAWLQSNRNGKRR